MVVYKISVVADDATYEYVGSTSRSIEKRIQEHNYKLKEPVCPLHNNRCYSRFYKKLRESGITKILPAHYTVLNDDLQGHDMLRREQDEINNIPMELCLNSQVVSTKI